MLMGATGRAWGDSCPNAALRVAAAAALPDCRAYEQVTPADKDYGVPTFNDEGGMPLVGLSSANGGSALLDALGPLPGSVSGGAEDFYLASRSANGWPITSITPPQTPIPGATSYPITEAFSPDLSKEIVLSANPPLTPDASPGIGNLYLRDNATGTYTLLTTAAGTAGESPTLRFCGASADWSTVVFEGGDPLTANAPPASGGNRYVYEWHAGQLSLVDVLPDGSPAPTGVCGAGAGNGERVAHVVSGDGSRIVFSATGQIWVRIDDSSTGEASASQASTADPNGPKDATFWAASSDGSKVFFTSASELTNDANTGRDSSGTPTDAGNDLYEYVCPAGVQCVTGGQLSDLTVDSNPADSATGADVQGVVGTSDDGSYVYFVADGTLAAGAVSGSPNLYLWHNGTTTFIATLDAADSGDWASLVNRLTARVTPDGRNMVFDSVASLTGYDNTDAATHAPDSEVFLYDASTNRLTCVSCNPSGAAPVGPSSIAPPALLTNMPRNVSDDGSRVFFDSADALVPQDVNGVQDVYEWEQAGNGSCQSAEGCVYLLSSGTSRYPAAFDDASATGDDVLFATRAQLVALDGDVLADLYDARVDGGLASQNPPPATAPCSGSETCHGTTGARPVPPTAATIAFSGPANVSPARRRRAVSVLSRVVHGATFLVRVRVSAGGRITIFGRGARRVSRFVRRAGTYRLKVGLTGKAKRRLQRTHRLRLRLHVRYASRGSRASTATVQLLIRPVYHGRRSAGSSSNDRGGVR